MSTAVAEPMRVVDPKNFDKNVRPADDFYRFANGTWLANNPIPDEHSRWGAFEEVHERSQAQVRDLLRESADAVSGGGVDPGAREMDVFRAIAGTLYATGVDEAGVEAAGMAPLHAAFALVDAAESPADVLVASASARMELGASNGAFWSARDATDNKDSARCVFHIAQGGLGIGDRDFYVDEGKAEIRGQYVAHLARMFVLIGYGAADAEARAAGMMALETRVAHATMTRTERRDPHKTYNKYAGPKELGEGTESGALPWARFFEVFGFAGTTFGGVIVDNPAFFKRWAELVVDDSIALDVWKAYAKYHIVDKMAGFLPKAVEDEHFEFHKKNMSGQKEQKPRWKRVLVAMDQCVEESVGKLYVARHFSPEAKAVCKEMVDWLTDIVRDRIADVEWMSASTKTRAHAKLARFRAKIGYPDVWDVSHCPALAEQVSTSLPYAANGLLAHRAAAARAFARVNRPTSPHQWYMPPQMVNACFIPTRNEICFPSAILQPPFFVAPSPARPHGDMAVNFAAIGAVICHEISHGYDDKGRLYDENGELNDWWAAGDADEYTRRASRMVAQYGRYRVFGTAVNGELCLGENVADLGGVKLAYAGFQRWMAAHGRPADEDALSPEQRFFLAWATVWRNNIRREMALKRIVMDPHSPGEFRANGPLSVLPEFHDAFGVRAEDNMFVPPEERCDIW